MIRPLTFFVLSQLLCAIAAAQTAASPQPLLDNEFVRVTRVSQPLHPNDDTDRALVQLSGETAIFIPKGSAIHVTSPVDPNDLIVELKNHWDVEVKPCAYPKQCTHETRMGGETVAWSTTLFTNGFVTATTHRLALHATLDSSYYTAKGSDRILIIPFTIFRANFGGIDESLTPGEPYFTKGIEVEVTAPDAETRWLVLRINTPER